MPKTFFRTGWLLKEPTQLYRFVCFPSRACCRLPESQALLTTKKFSIFVDQLQNFQYTSGLKVLESRANSENTKNSLPFNNFFGIRKNRIFEVYNLYIF